MASESDLRFGSETYKRIVKKSSGLLYTKHVNRNAAWFFTRLLKQFSPNAVSVGAFCLLIIGLVAFILNHSFGVVPVVLLYLVLFLNYVLDSTDGQIARITGKGSPVGEWVDHSLDALRMTVIHVAFIYFSFTTGISGILAALIFLNIMFQPPLFASNLLRQKLLPTSSSDHLGSERGLFSALLSLAKQPADHGLFVMIVLLLPWPELFHLAYAGYGLYWMLIYLLDMFITFRANSAAA